MLAFHIMGPLVCPRTSIRKISVARFSILRVIGPSDWLNVGRTFDAMVLISPSRTPNQHLRSRVNSVRPTLTKSQWLVASLVSLRLHSTVSQKCWQNWLVGNSGLPETVGRDVARYVHTS
jgi:hypothetical protein